MSSLSQSLENPVLNNTDNIRLQVSASLDTTQKSQLGQFMTPTGIAQFMVSLFPPSSLKNCRLLDPGAGIGALSSAFIDRWISGGFNFQTIDVTAYEIDAALRKTLQGLLAPYAQKKNVTHKIIPGDFIEEAINQLQFGLAQKFTHAIINPPYKKISNQSKHRLLLRQVGIETVNLYPAFVALALELLMPGGQ